MVEKVVFSEYGLRITKEVSDAGSGLEKECGMVAGGLCNLHEDSEIYDEYCSVGNSKDCPAYGGFQ